MNETVVRCGIQAGIHTIYQHQQAEVSQPQSMFNSVISPNLRSGFTPCQGPTAHPTPTPIVSNTCSETDLGCEGLVKRGGFEIESGHSTHNLNSWSLNSGAWFHKERDFTQYISPSPLSLLQSKTVSYLPHPCIFVSPITLVAPVHHQFVQRYSIDVKSITSTSEMYACSYKDTMKTSVDKCVGEPKKHFTLPLPPHILHRELEQGQQDYNQQQEKEKPLKSFSETAVYSASNSIYLGSMQHDSGVSGRHYHRLDVATSNVTSLTHSAPSLHTPLPLAAGEGRHNFPYGTEFESNPKTAFQHGKVFNVISSHHGYNPLVTSVPYRGDELFQHQSSGDDGELPRNDVYQTRQTPTCNNLLSSTQGNEELSCHCVHHTKRIPLCYFPVNNSIPNNDGLLHKGMYQNRRSLPHYTLSGRSETSTVYTTCPSPSQSSYIQSPSRCYQSLQEPAEMSASYFVKSREALPMQGHPHMSYQEDNNICPPLYPRESSIPSPSYQRECNTPPSPYTFKPLTSVNMVKGMSSQSKRTESSLSHPAEQSNPRSHPVPIIQLSSSSSTYEDSHSTASSLPSSCCLCANCLEHGNSPPSPQKSPRKNWSLRKFLVDRMLASSPYSSMGSSGSIGSRGSATDM